MHNLSRKLSLTILILVVPLLASAADTSSPPVAQPAAVEAPVKGAATNAPAGKPSDAPVAGPAVKIGYVDMARIADEAKSAKALQEKLKQKKDKLQARIDAKRKQLDKLRASLEAKLPSLAPPQREAQYREFQKKVEGFQKMARESEEELLKLQESGTKALYDDIEQACQVYGKANGLSAIVVKKELLYIGSGVDAQDVSEEVVKALNGAGRKD